jgi:hypothetical protein
MLRVCAHPEGQRAAVEAVVRQPHPFHDLAVVSLILPGQQIRDFSWIVEIASQKPSGMTGMFSQLSLAGSRGKFITHLMVTDNLKKFGKGLGCVDAEYGYAWYAGI